MENIDSKPELNFFKVNKEINVILLKIAKLGRAIAIIGYIGFALLIVYAVFKMLGISSLNNLKNIVVPSHFNGGFYLFASLIVLKMTSLIHQFSIKIRKGLRIEDYEMVIDGYQNLKQMFKYVGLMAVLFLSWGILFVILK